MVSKRIPPETTRSPAVVVVARLFKPDTSSPPVKVDVAEVVCLMVPPKVKPLESKPPAPRIRPPVKVEVAVEVEV